MPRLVAGCAVLAALSLALRSTLTHDSWAWVLWGRELAGLDLDLSGPLPAWKPLPVLVTTLLAPFGDAAPLLWLVVARTGALMAVALAWRLARRLGGRLAGAVAVASLLLSAGLADYMAPLGLSEPLLAALVLWAAERHLDGRSDHAFALGFAAALIRPEVWPFWLLYGVVAWRAHPHRRVPGALLVAAVPVLWLAPDLLVAGDVTRSFDAGRVPTARLMESSPGFAVLDAARRALHPAAWWGVAVALGAAAAGRGGQRAPVAGALALLGACWVALVAAMAELGVGGGLVRFLIVGSAAFSVLAGVGWAQALGTGTRLLARVGLERVAAATVAGALALAVLPARSTLAPTARARAGAWVGADFQERRHTQMAQLVAALGGPVSVRACGRPVVHSTLVPALAWNLRTPLGAIDFLETAEPASGVVFLARLRATDPPPLGAPSGFAVVARTPIWTVVARCPARSEVRIERPSAGS